MEYGIDDIFVLAGTAICIGTVVLCLLMLPKIRAYMPAFKQYRPLLFSLISRDLKVKYRRSVLGVLWSVLQPLFIMLIITTVFQHVFRVQVDNYPVFYITGVLIFNFVAEATNLSMNSILGAASLIKKTYIPKYIFPLQKCLFAIVNMLFSLIAVAIVYLVLRFPLQPTLLLFFVPMLYAAIFALGLSLILSAMVVYFRDIAHLYAIWITAWMYLTPILYQADILPPELQTLLKFNPLTYFVSYARSVMMDGVIPDFGQNMICLGFGLATLGIGLAVFKKAQDKFLLHI